MLNSILAGIISAVFSTVFADPLFIYSYSRSNKRKKLGKKYRSFGELFYCRQFWFMQIAVFIVAALIYFSVFKTFIEGHDFGNEIMMSLVLLLSAYGVGTIFHCVNVMWCVLHTPLGEVHDFVRDVLRKLVEVIIIGAFFVFNVMI